MERRYHLNTGVFERPASSEPLAVVCEMTERRRLQGFDAGWSDLSQGGTTIHGVEPTMKSLPGTTEWRTHLRTNSSRDGWHAVLAPDTNSRTSAGTLRSRNTIRLTARPAKQSDLTRTSEGPNLIKAPEI